MTERRNRTTYYLGPELIQRVCALAKALGHNESSFLRHFLATKLPDEEARVFGPDDRTDRPA